jgi:FixJ family two-component response regulator
MVHEETARREVTRAPVVCVIDDDESILRALRRLLGTTGFQVETFSSAEAFLESGRHGHADCLVLDVHLRGLSGLELQ